MKKLLALALLSFLLSAFQAGAAQFTFVVRSEKELEGLPEGLRAQPIKIVPDAEFSACDPGRGLFSLLTLTPEGLSQLWGPPKIIDSFQRSTAEHWKNNQPVERFYSWYNGLDLDFDKQGQVGLIRYRPKDVDFLLTEPLSLPFGPELLAYWGLSVVEPDIRRPDDILWRGEGGIIGLISVTPSKDGKTVAYYEISVHKWPGAEARDLHTAAIRGSQVGFVNIIEQAGLDYRTAGSSAKRELVALKRQRDLAAHLGEGLAFNNWLANVDDVALMESAEPGGSLRSKKSALVLKLFSFVMDLHNAWSGSTAENAILEGTPLFDTALDLTYQRVEISGHFVKDQEGGPSDTSATKAEGMSRPKFDVVFTKIKVLKQ